MRIVRAVAFGLLVVLVFYGVLTIHSSAIDWQVNELGLKGLLLGVAAVLVGCIGIVPLVSWRGRATR